jgi:hypothetical protein
MAASITGTRLLQAGRLSGWNRQGRVCSEPGNLVPLIVYG